MPAVHTEALAGRGETHRRMSAGSSGDRVLASYNTVSRDSMREVSAILLMSIFVTHPHSVALHSSGVFHDFKLIFSLFIGLMFEQGRQY